jgi:hypothetical protein
MKTNITIEYSSGEVATYVAAAPEWIKWERKTGYKIQEAESKLGMDDICFLAYNAMKREAAGTPVKPYDVWIETISEVTTANADPKAIPSEA